MSIGKRIRELRTEKGLSQIELGKIAGVTDKAVSTWEQDIKIPRMGAIEKIAAYFGVTKSYIIDGVLPEIELGIPPGFEPIPKMQKVPLVGHIACGQPITAEENLEGYVDAPAEKQIDFALTCHGDSMIDAGIHDGDTVYIRKQEEVENGQIAAIRIDDEATLKRVYYYPEEEKIILQAANAAYPPLSFSKEELEDISIEGLLIGFTHWMENRLL